MQGHLMPHAAKAEPKGMLQRRGSIFMVAKGNLDLIEEEFWIRVPKARERTPESCGVEKEGKLRVETIPP